MRISRPLRDWSSWPIGPSTGSALYLRSHPVQLVCAEPYWATIRSSLRDFALQTAVTTPGLERNAPSTEVCAFDPALDQQSGKAGTNVETPEYGIFRSVCYVSVLTVGRLVDANTHAIV